MPNFIYTGSNPPKHPLRLINHKRRYVKGYFENEITTASSGKIASIECYQSSSVKIKFICNSPDCSFIWPSLPSNILSGSGCPSCESKRKQSLRNTTDYISQRLKNKHLDKLSLVGVYTSLKCASEFRCNIDGCGHIWTSKVNSVINGTGCPECGMKKRISALRDNPYLGSNMTSKGEKEVLDFIKEIYKGLIVERDRTILRPKELDIVIPNLKIAIEYNGDYWHKKKPVGYHADKTRRCAEQGIKLLHIWESDWKKNKREIKEKLRILLDNE